MPSFLNYQDEFTSFRTKNAEKAFRPDINLSSCPFHSPANLHLCYGERENSFVFRAGVARKTLDISPELQIKVQEVCRWKILPYPPKYVIFQTAKRNTSIRFSEGALHAFRFAQVSERLWHKGLNLTLEKKRPNLRGKLEANLFLDRHLSESALWFISQSVGRNTNACSKQQSALPIRPS